MNCWTSRKEKDVTTKRKNADEEDVSWSTSPTAACGQQLQVLFNLFFLKPFTFSYIDVVVQWALRGRVTLIDVVDKGSIINLHSSNVRDT